MPTIVAPIVVSSLIMALTQSAPSMTWELVRIKAVPAGCGVSNIKPEPFHWSVSILTTEGLTLSTTEASVGVGVGVGGTVVGVGGTTVGVRVGGTTVGVGVDGTTVGVGVGLASTVA